VSEPAHPKYPHLAPAVSRIAEMPNEERLPYVTPAKRWIAYDRAVGIHAEFKRLFNFPQRDRMPNMLLIGDSGNGKTRIVSKFVDDHSLPMQSKDEVRETPVLLVTMPSTPSISEFYRNILGQYGTPYTKSTRDHDLERLVIEIASRVKTRLILIDEVQHLLATTKPKQRQVLNVIKSLSNSLRISMVAAGTEEAMYAWRTDPQMVSRFETFRLPLWGFGRELAQMLMAFERTLPLRKPSNLGDDKIAKLLLSRTTCTIGSISNALERAAEDAINDGSEQITYDSLLGMFKKRGFYDGTG